LLLLLLTKFVFRSWGADYTRNVSNSSLPESFENSRTNARQSTGQRPKAEKMEGPALRRTTHAEKRDQEPQASPEPRSSAARMSTQMLPPKFCKIKAALAWKLFGNYR